MSEITTMPEVQDKPDIELFTKAAAHGNLSAVQEFLEKWPGHINTPDNHSWTALMHAAWHGHETLVSLLLSRDASRSLIDKWGRSAWVLARKMRHKNIMEMIHPRPLRNKE